MIKKIFFLLTAIFLISSCKTAAIKNAEIQMISASPQTIFKPGDSGYNCFRIPAIVVAKNGDVLAFAEARKKSCSDTGDIDLVMRISKDHGKTWSPLTVVFDDAKNVCGNPAPVVDQITGEVHLLTTWNNGYDHESEIINGTSKASRDIYYLKSSDHGKTWSTPKNITSSVKKPNWTWYATGPVHGIQLQSKKYKGRLVIPCDHIEKDSKKYYSHSIYSDDHGRTWHLGGTTPKDQVNECSVAELPNGDLYLNMRNYERKEKQARQIAYSSDGGITWKDQTIDESLPEPRCQGAVLTVRKRNKKLLAFLNPANTTQRANLTLRISGSEGKNWELAKQIYAEFAAYSDLAQLKNGNLILFYEGGEKHPYEGIHIVVINLKI